jgi:hypothetical protein
VVYDFCDSRAGAHARAFLGQWQGTLLTDDFSGYKQLYTQGIIEAGCWAHARRKFFDLNTANASPMAAQALIYIGQLYDIEREVKPLSADDDPHLPIDNNHIENQIRPIALGKKNWLFAGSLRAGQRAAAIMSLIHSARLNGHDPYVYLNDVLTRLPPHKNSQIDELLPHLWRPQPAAPASTASSVSPSPAN